MATNKPTHTPELDGQGDHYENCGFPAKECHCLSLIAAAPDLLAFAQSIVIGADAPASSLPTRAQWSAIVSQARAANAKASGQES